MSRTARFSIALVALSAVPAIAADIDGPIIGDVRPVTYASDTSASVISHSGVSGYIEGSFSKAFDMPYEMDSHAWALRGSVNVESDDGLNLQVDGGYARTTVENVDVDQLAGAGHVYYRDPSFAVGGFFQASAIDAGYLGYFGDETIKDYMGGVEAAWFADQGTVYGRAGYGLAKWADYSADHYMGAIGVRYYVQDNLRFDIEGSLNRISYASADLDTGSLVLSGNYRPDAVPATLFAGYRYDHLDLSDSGVSLTQGNTSTIFAGVRFSFGSQSLKDEERKGPVWTASTLLP